jgi:hypothetical protein
VGRAGASCVEVRGVPAWCGGSGAFPANCERTRQVLWAPARVCAGWGGMCDRRGQPAADAYPFTHADSAQKVLLSPTVNVEWLKPLSPPGRYLGRGTLGAQETLQWHNRFNIAFLSFPRYRAS